MKSLFSIFLLALSALIFFYVGMPLINGSESALLQQYVLTGRESDKSGQGLGIKGLQAEANRLNSALEITKQLSEIDAELKMRVNSIDQTQLQNLDRFLPDSLDNVQLVLDVNSIAVSSGMKIKNIKIDDSEQKSTDVTLPIASSTEPQVSKLKMSFTVEGSYETFLGFLDNLSKSLRLLDVLSIKFSADDKGANFYKYDVTIQTYWLK
ncbi:MAG: type 4a pilus biogenesis protein PilO [Candidatus Paceibacterota bacterium]|jgi:Tfp pilus assembly protein PilO